MRVINSRTGVLLDSMAAGETFKDDYDYWIVTDYYKDNDKVACVNLSSGYTMFLSGNMVVIPVTAEVHIYE